MSVSQSGNSIVNLEVTCDVKYSEQCEGSQYVDVEVDIEEYSMPVREIAVESAGEGGWVYVGGEVTCPPCQRVQENIKRKK